MPCVTKKSTPQWRCSQCPKAFGRKGDLTRHEFLHAGIRPHLCETCCKAFSQFSGLKTHMNVHTGAKPFICSFNGCEAAFGDPSSAARHRKETHRRVGAYRCPHLHCRSSIKRRSAFAAHLKSKHNIDPANLDLDSMAPPLLPAPISIKRRKSYAEVVLDLTPYKREDSWPTIKEELTASPNFHEQDLTEWLESVPALRGWEHLPKPYQPPPPPSSSSSTQVSLSPPMYNHQGFKDNKLCTMEAFSRPHTPLLVYPPSYSPFSTSSPTNQVDLAAGASVRSFQFQPQMLGKQPEELYFTRLGYGYPALDHPDYFTTFQPHW